MQTRIRIIHILSNREVIAEPLKDIHLGGKVNFEPGSSSDIRYIYLITSIGILIILIACFNYMNMATARSYNRGRETGILKVSGSSKKDLIIQYLTESILLAFGGLLLALIIVWLLLPLLSDFTDRPLYFGMILKFNTILKIICLVLMSGLIAGLYPAIHLSSFSPLSLLKEDFKNSGKRQRSGYLRSVLIVFQYIISIVALISAFTVLRQLNFIKKTDLGFVKDNILTVTLKIRLSEKILMY
ncbi:MAG: FtsX-like permease family protein [Bacteroidales bacterium]|nr:FtsX-like permease family protein [Bacteroidales bacterium]